MTQEASFPLTGPVPFAWGTFYPKGCVVSVIDNGAQAQQAAAALQQSDFAQDDIRVFTGEEVLNHHNAYLEQQTRFERVAALFADAEKRGQEQYLLEAQLGNFIVIVRAPERQDAVRALHILATHGGHAIRHYTPSMVAELKP